MRIKGSLTMNRLVSLAVTASICFVTITPTFAQGRYAREAAEAKARRMEREAIRQAEYPELYAKPADTPAKAPVHVAGGAGQTEETTAAAKPAPVSEPAPLATPAQ